MSAHKPAGARARLRLALPALLAGIAALSAGCSVLPERTPNRIYEPAHISSPGKADWPKASWSLLVPAPKAGRQLDSDRITVRPSPGVIQVYQDASWIDSAPELVQASLLRHFEDSQKIPAASPPGGGVRGEYLLLSELRAFESVYVQPGQPQVQVELFVRLVHSGDGKVVAARAFRETEDSGSEELSAVVDAFSRALDRASSDIVGWTLINGQKAEAMPAGSAR
jgi:cholesterol transport system auxiliary component